MRLPTAAALISMALFSGCGEGRTPLRLGQTVSGTITRDDSCWVSCSPEKPGETQQCSGGCSHRYEIDVTAGMTYVITFGPGSTPEVQFEDLEGGKFTDRNGGKGTSTSARSSPATWVPVETGVNRVGVYGLVDFLPATYSVTVTKQ